MTVTVEGHGYVTELDTSPASAVVTSEGVCGNLGFDFAGFAFGDAGRATVWISGVQIGACLAPRGVRICVDDTSRDLSDDTIVVRSPGSVSAANWDRGFVGQFLNLAPETIERFFHTPLGRIAFKDGNIVVPSHDRPVLLHLLGAISHDLAAGNPGGPMFLESLSAAALRAIVDTPSESKRPVRGLAAEQAKTLRDLIITRSSEPISLVDLAEAVDLSVGHMLRSFKVTFGVTPHQYLIRERVECAQRLLKQTGKGLDEIAADTGFGTRAQMSRTFRTVLGIAPKDAR